MNVDLPKDSVEQIETILQWRASTHLNDPMIYAQLLDEEEKDESDELELYSGHSWEEIWLKAQANQLKRTKGLLNLIQEVLDKLMKDYPKIYPEEGLGGVVDMILDNPFRFNFKRASII